MPSKDADNVIQLFAADKQPPKEPTALMRWQKLALSFPSVAAALVGNNWPTDTLTPESLDAYIGTVYAHNGIRWAASFLLAVWKPGHNWLNTPNWNPVSAMSCWDSWHKRSWQAWSADPVFF